MVHWIFLHWPRVYLLSEVAARGLKEGRTCSVLLGGGLNPEIPWTVLIGSILKLKKGSEGILGELELGQETQAQVYLSMSL